MFWRWNGCMLTSVLGRFHEWHSDTHTFVHELWDCNILYMVNSEANIYMSWYFISCISPHVLQRKLWCNLRFFLYWGYYISNIAAIILSSVQDIFNKQYTQTHTKNIGWSSVLGFLAKHCTTQEDGRLIRVSWRNVNGK